MDTECIRDSDRRLLHTIVDGAFHDAAALVGESSANYSIAGETIRIIFAGDALAQPLTRAIVQHRVDDNLVPTAMIHAWDTRSTGRQLPMLAASLLRLLDRTWLDDRDVRGEIKGYSNGTLRAAYYGPQLLALFDVVSRVGIFWLEDAASLPWYEPGAPFRVLLDWIVSSPTRQLVHAGAIAGRHGGVILGGPGGSGKSTTALACLRSGIGSPNGEGLRYVSDDYIVIDIASQPHAYGPYSTAKVKGLKDLERFPTLTAGVTNLTDAMEQVGRTDAVKPMLFVHEQHPERMATGTPIHAVVFPRYLALDECAITPIDPSTAFKMLAPSTVSQIPTTRSQSLRSMRKLVFTVPCYTLGLPTDPTKIPAAIEEILDASAKRVVTQETAKQ